VEARSESHGEEDKAITLTVTIGKVVWLGAQLSPLHHHLQCSFTAPRLPPHAVGRLPCSKCVCASSFTLHSRAHHPLNSRHLFPHRYSINLCNYPAIPSIMNGHANGNGSTNGGASSSSSTTSAGAVGTFRVKAGLAQMLKGGVIMGTWMFGIYDGGVEEMHLRWEGPRSIVSLRAVAELAVIQRTSGPAHEVWRGSVGPRLSHRRPLLVLRPPFHP